MNLFVLDTDILSLYYRGHPAVVGNVLSRSVNELSISVMTVDEQLTGWYSVTRRARLPDEIARAYANLGDAIGRLSKMRIPPYTVPAIAKVANLKTLRLNVGLMDLRIAAIALEHGAIIVTRNRRDFSRIPGLPIEDWSV